MAHGRRRSWPPSERGGRGAAAGGATGLGGGGWGGCGGRVSGGGGVGGIRRGVRVLASVHGRDGDDGDRCSQPGAVPLAGDRAEYQRRAAGGADLADGVRGLDAGGSAAGSDLPGGAAEPGGGRAGQPELAVHPRRAGGDGRLACRRVLSLAAAALAGGGGGGGLRGDVRLGDAAPGGARALNSERTTQNDADRAAAILSLCP